jgi:hypothetical protein
MQANTQLPRLISSSRWMTTSWTMAVWVLEIILGADRLPSLGFAGTEIG